MEYREGIRKDNGKEDDQPPTNKKKEDNQKLRRLNLKN